MNEHFRLIQMVKARPFLYDPLDHQYKNNGQKRVVWDEIAAKIEGIPSGIVAKLRWRTLRDTYVKYLKAIRSTPPGQKKRWQYAQAMSFLMPFLTKQHARRITAVDPLLPIQSSIKASDEETVEDQCEIKVEEPDFHREEVQLNTMHQLDEENMDFKNDGNASTSDFSPAVNDYLKRTNLTHADAIDLLFLSYAQTLKTFAERRQTETKMKIANIIMQAELEDIEEKETKNNM